MIPLFDKQYLIDKQSKRTHGAESILRAHFEGYFGTPSTPNYAFETVPTVRNSIGYLSRLRNLKNNVIVYEFDKPYFATVIKKDNDSPDIPYIDLVGIKPQRVQTSMFPIGRQSFTATALPKITGFTLSYQDVDRGVGPPIFKRDGFEITFESIKKEEFNIAQQSAKPKPYVPWWQQYK